MTRDAPRTRTISANVKAEIARAGLTQTAVAKAVQLSYAQWQRRTSGATEWRIDELQRVARVLDVRLDVLTGDRGDGSTGGSTS